MNRKLASALLIAATTLAGNAFADGGPTDPTSMQYNPLAQFQSSQSRDQVAADYLASHNQVAAFTDEDSGSAVLAGNFKSAKSRDQVTAEYLASRNQVAAFTGEDSGSLYLAQRRVQGGDNTRLAGQPRGAQ
jgi:hypothetical protein